MREIRGRRGTLHKFLEDEKVKTAFAQNIKDEKHSSGSAYNDGKSDNKDSLKWTLKQIYHEKCAFCESYIKNEVGDIEHFRPKNKNVNQAKKCDKTYSYYWLAFSWDNLLPCCSRCNGKKSNCFDIMGNRIKYNNEKLADLHDKIEKYNKDEKPKLLHPEYDNFESDIRFSKYGEIESENERVNYTVEICDLNRTNLKESRRTIITDFVENLHRHLESFDNNLTDDNFDECLEYFRVTIEDFLETIDIDVEDEDYARKIILVAFFEFCSEIE